MLNMQDYQSLRILNKESVVIPNYYWFYSISLEYPVS